MRSLEDDCRGETSEDEHPSTDTSEDSVEVRVAPIVRPNPAHAHTRTEGVRRLPRKFRKAFERSISPVTAAPLDFSVTSLAGATDPPRQGASPPAPTREVSPPRSKVSRRKPSEPRRVVEPEHHQPHGSKRSHPEEEWPPRKAAKSEGPSRLNPGTIPGPPFPGQHEMLGPSPFMGPFVPPHLLLPPTWPHVARYPYAHLVGGMLGSPLGFLPSAPYPLLPILPPRPPAPSSTSPRVSPREPFSPEVEKRLRVNGVGITPPVQPHPPSPHSLENEPLISSPVKRRSPKPSTPHRKFLSVESLLSVPSPDPKLSSEGRLDSTTPPPPRDPLLQDEEDSNPEALDPSPSSSGEGGTIQSLLQRPSGKQKQRNYKNMTRERRIEANARERTRVHTISAAFETLRRAVPSFSHNQKLSKLSVLRIASSYILALSRLAGLDYSRGESNPSLEECVDLTTKTIQIEGKTKKKRDD